MLFSPAKSSSEVLEKLKSLQLKITQDEQASNLRARSSRAAAIKSQSNPIVEDALDDSDEDSHFKLPTSDNSSSSPDSSGLEEDESNPKLSQKVTSMYFLKKLYFS